MIYMYVFKLFNNIILFSQFSVNLGQCSQEPSPFYNIRTMYFISEYRSNFSLYRDNLYTIFRINNFFHLENKTVLIPTRVFLFEI